uniref:Ion transport domain-containing protein n=1 Tax=Fundulus heteroclitus TaxID=8078 RepID=A0A3Q2QE29_FUNHE
MVCVSYLTDTTCFIFVSDETNGKTALLKALLNLKDGKNDTIEVLIDIAEKTGDLDNLINAAYTDPCYKGQTALHVAIERRSFDYVKLLVQKGADVQATANGTFFQRNAGLGFYFGELPLSLAACTNQPEMVSFLMENPDRRADPTQRDSQGNTVLHILVVIADDSTENTEVVANMYDRILVQHYKLSKGGRVQLEWMENNEGLTPLKLAAKLGKIGVGLFAPQQSNVSVTASKPGWYSDVPSYQELFFLQAVLLLMCAVLYFCGRREYVGLLVLSLALAWMNVLYYTRGSRQLGIYNVMMQRMILGDLLHFLCVYIVLLFGFSAAICTLIDDSADHAGTKQSNATKPSYNDIRFTTLELLKFTIGMGDLEFTDHVQYKEVFYILLICYIVLTYILMLNMLIALMGNTVERISEQSETIWNLQVRGSAFWDKRSQDYIKYVPAAVDVAAHLALVTEMKWEKWRSDLGTELKEDPVNHIMNAPTHQERSGRETFTVVSCCLES